MSILQDNGLSKGDNVVVKVGSNLLAGDTSNVECRVLGIDHCNLYNIVNSVDYLIKLGLNVFLVTSGAVSIGKIELEKTGEVFENDLNTNQKAFLSGIGQNNLMSLYRTLFKEKNRLVSQNLLTHNDFIEGNNLNNLKNIWDLCIYKKVIPIINENDIVSREELGFSDNDELAGLVAKTINAKILFLLTDVNGLYKNYKQSDEELVRNVDDIESVRKYSKGKIEEGSHGKGFMDSKLNVMGDIIKQSILGIIANGAKKNIIQEIMEGNYNNYTRFQNTTKKSK